FQSTLNYRFSTVRTGDFHGEATLIHRKRGKEDWWRRRGRAGPSWAATAAKLRTRWSPKPRVGAFAASGAAKIHPTAGSPFGVGSQPRRTRPNSTLRHHDCRHHGR